jgi:peptidoglycan/LPS O-acetylase OafA/YrhL
MRYPTRFFAPRTRASSSPKVDSNHNFYHPELDALRFFAFLAVFMHHALPRDAQLYVSKGFSPAVAEWLLAAKEAGAFGLDLFFALSAYLITELLLREHANRGSFSVSAFYVRRALRIWPLYFTFLALTVFVVPTILPAERFGSIYIVSFALFFGNWVCAAMGIPFSVAGPLWSISIEEQFYIGWPLLLRAFGIRRLKQLAVAMLVLAVLTRVVLAFIGVEHPGVWCNTIARLDPFALGAILAFALNGRAPEIRNAVRVVMCLAALAAWWLIAKYLEQDGPTSIVTFGISAVASVMLLTAVLRREALLLRVPPLSWIVYLGRISYGLYVFHLFALAFVMRFAVSAGFEVRIVLSFLLTVTLAAASYKWLEQPFLKLKKRFSYGSSRGDKFDSPSHGHDVKSRFATS